MYRIINILFFLSVLLLTDCTEQKEDEFLFELDSVGEKSTVTDTTFFGSANDMAYYNENLYITDNTPKIMKLNSDLNLENLIHDIGKGPSEFTGLSDISYYNDSLFVYNRSQSKILVYDNEMTFKRSFKLGKSSSGHDVAVGSNGNVYISTPRSERPISIFNLQGAFIKAIGENLAEKDSHNAMRNSRMLLSYDDKVLAISRSDPIVEVYRVNGDLLKRNEISHPLLDDRIEYIKDSYQNPGHPVALTLEILFHYATIYDSRLYFLGVTYVDSNQKPNFTFILSYNINPDGNLEYYKSYKLFYADRQIPLPAIKFSVLDNNRIVVFDRRKDGLVIFKDDQI